MKQAHHFLCLSQLLILEPISCTPKLIAPSSLLLYICACINIYFNTTYWVCFCCLCIYAFLLTTLHWTTKRGAHSWKRLIILLAVISACWSVFRGSPPPGFSLHINISIDIVIVLLVFMQPFLRVDLDFLVFGLIVFPPSSTKFPEA